MSSIVGRTDVDLVFPSANRSLSFFVDSTSVPFLTFCSWRLRVIYSIFIVLGLLVHCFLQQNADDWLVKFPSSRLANPNCDANFVGLVSLAGHGFSALGSSAMSLSVLVFLCGVLFELVILQLINDAQRQLLPCYCWELHFLL